MELVSVSFQLKQIVNRGTHYLMSVKHKDMYFLESCAQTAGFYNNNNIFY